MVCQPAFCCFGTSSSESARTDCGLSRKVGSVLKAFRTSVHAIQRTATEFEWGWSDASEAFERQRMIAHGTSQTRIVRPHQDRRRPVFELQIRIKVLPRLQDRAAEGFHVGLSTSTEQSEVPHFVHTFRQHMLQEAVQELLWPKLLNVSLNNSLRPAEHHFLELLRSTSTSCEIYELEAFQRSP